MPFQMPDVTAPLLALQPDPPQSYADYQTEQFEAEKRRVARDTLRRTEADERTFRQITAETGGDPRKMLPRLRALAPQRALEFEKLWNESRKVQAERAIKDNELEEKELSLGRSWMQSATPRNWQYIRETLIKPRLPELYEATPVEFDPVVINKLIEGGMKEHEYIKQQFDFWKFLQEGKPREAAAIAFSQADTLEEWEGVRTTLRHQNVPESVIAQFGDFGPDAQKRAENLGLTVDARKDNERAAARDEWLKQREKEQLGLESRRTVTGEKAQAASERHQRAMEGIARSTADRLAKAAAGKGAGDPNFEKLVDQAIERPWILTGETVTPTLRTEVLTAIAGRGLQVPDLSKLSVGTGRELEAMQTARDLANDFLAGGGETGEYEGVGNYWGGTLSELNARYGRGATDKAIANRAALGNIRSAIMLIRSGTAVNPSEKETLMTFLPHHNNSDQEIRVKLKGLQDWVDKKQKNLIGVQRGQWAGATAQTPAAPAAQTPSSSRYERYRNRK